MSWEDWIKKCRDHIFILGVIFSGSDELLRPYFEAGYSYTFAAEEYVTEISKSKVRL